MRSCTSCRWASSGRKRLLLELCACTLFDALFLHGDRNYRLPEASAKVYLASVALALRHLHRAGFVFRDLKMENVTRLRMTTHPVEFDMYYSL